MVFFEPTDQEKKDFYFDDGSNINKKDDFPVLSVKDSPTAEVKVIDNQLQVNVIPSQIPSFTKNQIFKFISLRA